MGKITEISEHDCVEMSPGQVEDTFYDSKGETKLIVYAWGGGNRYIKAIVTASYSNFTSTNNSNNDVIDMKDGSKLIYKWNPAEPSVGMSNPYREKPIIFQDSNGDRFDVLGLEKKH
jgi:hypothetical protein